MIRNCMIIFNFLIPVEALAADTLGRLFYSPEQRTQLELARARRDVRLPITTEAAPVAEAPKPQGPDRVTYNGVVRRDDGKSTVWINGRAVNEGNRAGMGNDINVLGMQNDGAVSLAVPHAARTASLKVGQSLDVSSGRIEESYARGGTALAPKQNARAATAPAPLAAIPALRPRDVRPLRESHFQDAHPESGAAAVPLDNTKK